MVKTIKDKREVRLTNRPLSLPRGAETVYVHHGKHFGVAVILPECERPMRHIGDLGSTRMVMCPKLGLLWIPQHDDSISDLIDKCLATDAKFGYSDDIDLDFDAYHSQLYAWVITEQTKKSIEGGPFLLGNVRASGSVCQGGGALTPRNEGPSQVVNRFLMAAFNSDIFYGKAVHQAAYTLPNSPLTPRGKKLVSRETRADELASKLLEALSLLNFTGKKSTSLLVSLKYLVKEQDDLENEITTLDNLLSKYINGVAPLTKAAEEKIISAVEVVTDKTRKISEIDEWSTELIAPLIDDLLYEAECGVIDINTPNLDNLLSQLDNCDWNSNSLNEEMGEFVVNRSSKEAKSFFRKHSEFSKKLTAAVKGSVDKWTKITQSQIEALKTATESSRRIIGELYEIAVNDDDESEEDRMFDKKLSLTSNEFFSLLPRHVELSKALRAVADLTPIFNPSVMVSTAAPDILVWDEALSEVYGSIIPRYDHQGLAFGWFVPQADRYIVQVNDDFYVLNKNKTELTLLSVLPDGSLYLPDPKG